MLANAHIEAYDPSEYIQTVSHPSNLPYLPPPPPPLTPPNLYSPISRR